MVGNLLDCGQERAMRPSRATIMEGAAHERAGQLQMVISSLENRYIVRDV